MLPAVETERPLQQEQVGVRARGVPSAKNRGRLDVVADILAACAEPASKNSILIRANVNSVTATYMLSELIGARLLDTVVEEDGRVTYIATKQGAAFAASYRNLSLMLTPALVPETRAKLEIGLFG